MANLSSVVTQTVGTSVAGVNLITAPNDSSIWTVSTITKATTTTAAELPLGPAIPTATKFTLAASPGTGYVDFECPAALLNWSLQLGWFARASSGFTAAIAIASIKSYSSASNRTSDTSGTTITPRSSTIQGTALSFFTTIDTHATNQYYRMTLSFAAQVSAWYSICQVQVGPGSTEQVPAVGDIAISPTVIGATNSLAFTNTTVDSITGQRVGSWLEITGKILFTGLPATGTGTLVVRVSTSGPTIDSTKDQNWSGSGVFYDASASGAMYNLSPAAYMTSSNIDLQFGVTGETGSTAYLNPASVPVAFANGDFMTFVARIPIAEWAGSVNTGSAPVEEFAFNTSVATTGDDSTSFGYGQAGAQIVNITASGKRRVRFQYPIQDDDIIEVQVKKSASAPWIILDHWDPTTGLQPYQVQSGGTSYGLGIDYTAVNATDIDVLFGTYCYASGATLGAAGAAWSGANAFKWRVRKTKKASLPFAKADSSSSGLVAPRKGQYALTVTGTNYVAVRAVGIYYQDQDANHRLKFNIAGTLSVTATSFTGTITGVTFKNVANYVQAITASLGEASVAARATLEAYVNPGLSTFYVSTVSGNTNLIRVSGDVELDSKPSWA